MNILLRVVGMAYSKNVTGEMILQHITDNPDGLQDTFAAPGVLSDTPLFVASQKVIAQLQFAEEDDGRIC